jgi:2-keto-3-deoxy-L-arabinonate dehydratase
MPIRTIAGVCPVLAIPFLEDGAVDFESLSREVDFELELGADALVIFGLGSEVYKLTDTERRAICEHLVNRIRGAVPLVAGTEHTGTEGAVARSLEAQELGADAVMLYPPCFVKPEPAGIIDYYAAVSDAIGIPIVVQDAQAWTGVPLPAGLLLEIARRAPRVQYVKAETVPTGRRVTEILESTMRRLQVLGGFGGVYYYDEMRRGIVGAFIGCGMTDVFREIADHFQRNDVAAASHHFERYLALLVFALTTLDAFNEIQKRLLVKAGVFRTSRMRRPHVALDAQQHAYLEELLGRLPLKATARRPGA